MNPRIAVIIGTRPCIIKQWSPYVNLKKQKNLDTFLVYSNQHEFIGTQAQETFNLTPDHICQINPDDRLDLTRLVVKLISELNQAFAIYNPDLVLVHGDTSTAFAASVAAFLRNIPIGHVEAGLRTSRFESPFPEEGYRRQISRITTLHFAPTNRAAENLYFEGINPMWVHIVGNSVVDALQHVLKKPISLELRKILDWVDNYKTILVTCHRRESYGEPLKNLCNSLITIANSVPYAKIIFPVHPNSKIKDVVTKLEHDKILLVEPQEYSDFTGLLNYSDLIITDSGGVLEEAVVLGKPTLILREHTERPEALDLDCINLVGYDFTELERLAKKWLEKPPKTETSNIFGTGDTGIEITEIIQNWFYEQHNKN